MSILVAACKCQSWARVWDDQAPERLREQMREHLVKHADRPDLHKIWLANHAAGYELQMDMVSVPE